MDSSRDEQSKLITDLNSLKENPNSHLVLVVFVIGFFLLNFLYFETEMDSNYIGIFFAMLLVQLSRLYKESIERNKLIVRIIDEINSNYKEQESSGHP
ncbi:hypothetical protein [Thalassotalea marina]|uniref:Uncharacterized protein n=1 Tax=Thalassotalea marina TaxID=1673741 RepID=A0A919BQI3_9GAMM|nr:hypothetical protein [Thalassotalea marina]GHG05842.1 hypothetical protein GCM10017161_39210 [Thalassotalea marina]